MHSLDKRLEMERSIHKEDNMRIMYMNKELITHITDLRAEITKKERVQRKKINDLKELKSKYGDIIESPTLPPVQSNDSIQQDRNQKTLELQHQQIYDLESYKQQHQQQINELRGRIEEQKQELMSLQQMFGQN